MDNETYFEKIDSAPASLFNLALGHESDNDRYTGMEQIGSGAIKKIQRVLDLTSGRPVALALPNESLTKEQVQHFLEEARLTASLEHPNIIPVYDLGFNQQGTPYFTMKLCSTQKLADILQGDESSLFQLLDIFLKICEAMACAHNAGAIHRDLKPENILLGNFGEVFVCDWGSAQIIPGSVLEQEVGQLSKALTKGTPGFMSPEQLAGEPAHINQDIYTMGALLYKILTGKAPAEKNIAAPSNLNPNTPTGLEAICLKAMSEKASVRYQKTEELIADIKAWMSGFAPSAEQASFQKQLKLLIIRNKTLSISILASLLIISCLSLFYINSLKEKEKQTRIQRDRAEKALELYDLEKENREKIAKLGADYFIKQANQLVTAMKRDMAIELLDSIPQKDLTAKQTRSMNAVYGRVYVYKQRFQAAYKHLQNAEGYDSKFLLGIAREYASIKKNDEDMLNTKQTVKILGQLNEYDIHQAHCFYRDQVLRIPDYTEQVALIEKMTFINNEWMEKVNIKLTVQDGRYHLDLSNNPTMRRWVPVRQMPLTSLNLSNNGKMQNDFSVLYNMPLERLNISGSVVNKFNFLKKLKQLKTIIIDPQQAENKSFKEFSKGLEVVVNN